MKILIACEESQIVCKTFRDKGHEAYSCDIQDCSGGHPEWHIKDDVLKVIDDNWDMMIAHPPCTYLTLAANKYYDEKVYGKKAIKRKQDRIDAVEFFLKLWNANIPKICIENPVGIMCNYIDRKNYQIIQPYYFGDPERKTTQLWIKNLPPLQYGHGLFFQSDVVKPNLIIYENGKTDSAWHYNTFNFPKDQRAKLRSKTFPGVAKGMANQWG
jgi:hypothetical protein